MSVKPETSLVSQLAEMIGYFAMTFACAVGVSYAYFTLRKRRCKTPVLGGTVRLRAVSGVYRTRFLRETPEGWVFSAPLKRDAYVPLREDEAVTAECPTDCGVLLFRTKVVSRNAETHEFTLEKPKNLEARERRATKRAKISGLKIAIEELDADLVDISESGAKAVLSRRLTHGERVGVKLPWLEEPVYAAVLDTQVEDARGHYSARMVFERPIKVNWSGLQFSSEA